MEKTYSVGEAARIVGMTSEALRHYDRVGLAKPSRVDEWTKYRRYSEADIVRLNAIRALKLMGLSLREIREILDCDDLERLVAALTRAEARADERIAEIQCAKARILRARDDYAKKLQGATDKHEAFVRHFPERVILLSDALEAPTLDHLWNYLRRFYDQIGRTAPAAREKFAFEDLAGIYTSGGESRMFAQCLRYAEAPGLRTLPEGNYLCADCSEEERARRMDELLAEAKTRYGVAPEFHLQIIVVSGVLIWRYQLQIHIGS